MEPRKIKRITKASVNTATGYIGHAATGRDESGREFILIAPDMETLEALWGTFSPTPLDRGKVPEVAMFQRADLAI